MNLEIINKTYKEAVQGFQEEWFEKASEKWGRSITAID